MPRLTFPYDCARRDYLQLILAGEPERVRVVAAQAALDVHAFYRPLDGLSEFELRRHWEHIRTTNPSLPNRAGKAYLRLHRILIGSLERPTPRPQRVLRDAPIRATGVVRPNRDSERLARALLLMVREQSRADQEREAA